MINFLDVTKMTPEVVKLRMDEILEENKLQQWAQLDDFEHGLTEHPMLLSETLCYTGLGLPDVEFVYDIETTEYNINDKFTTFDKDEAFNQLIVEIETAKLAQ